jgi:hypothetical protein
MAWSVLQEKSNFGSSLNATVTFTTANVSAGTKIIVWITVDASASPQSSVTSVKDGALNTWTLVAGPASDNSTGATFCYALDTPAGDVGTKPTITATLTSNFGWAIIVQEVSGLLAGNTTAMRDGTPGLANASSTGPCVPGAYSTAAANEYLMAAAGDPGNSRTISNSAGYTASSAPNINTSSTADLFVAWKNSTGGAESASFAITGTANPWFAVIVAFQLDAGGGGPAVAPHIGGKQWRRRRRHRQRWLPVPDVAAAVTPAAVLAPQRPAIVSRAASRARLGSRGMCAAGIAVASVVTAQPAAVVQRPPVPVTRPAPARAHLGPQGRNAGGIASAIVTPRGAPSRPRPFVFRSPAPARARLGTASLPGDGTPGAAAATPGTPARPRPFIFRSPPPGRARLGPAGLPGDGTASGIVTPRGTPGPSWRPQPRRPGPQRALWHGNAAPQAIAPVITAYQRPPVSFPRRRPARAVQDGYASQVVTPRGTPGPSWRPQPRRPAPSRAVWHGNAGPSAVAAPAPQPYAKPLPQPRSLPPRRAVWRGNASRAVTPLGTAARRPGPQISSKPRTRAVWHGNAGAPPPPASAAPPRWRRLPDRRRPQRALTRGLAAPFVPPPPFTIGALTARDAPGSTLTAAGASAALTASTAAGGTLAAGTSGAASGSGYQPAYPPYYGAPPSGTLTAADARTGGPG